MVSLSDTDRRLTYVAKRKQDVPPLVGRKEAAQLLGVKSTNLQRNNLGKVLPRPLQETHDGIEVAATSLWLREDIEKVREDRKKQRKAPA